ncbi:MAG: homoserine kinase [Alphaproteobacteria bacterium]|nr:homoserine kinase [Alphaproteobacteria bacterium]
MAVYTHLSADEIESLLERYQGLGTLTSSLGIAEGVENSNYLLVTEAPDEHGTLLEYKYILTIFEQRVKEEELPFFINLMEHLAAKGIPCPLPLQARDGSVIQRLAGTNKQAVLVSFLSGRSVTVRHIQNQHVKDLGEVLGAMHNAAKDYSGKRVNALSLSGWRKLFERTAERADEVLPGMAQIIEDELHHLMGAWPGPATLPSGVIHADLFPDNVFFRDGRLSGVIDFYFACSDSFAYDLAITMNAWCFEPDGAFNVTKARALFTGYQQQRQLTDAERKHFTTLARGAALRFMLTRLHDKLFQVEGALVTPKDPLEYYRKLQFHQSIKGFGAYGL